MERANLFRAIAAALSLLFVGGWCIADDDKDRPLEKKLETMKAKFKEKAPPAVQKLFKKGLKDVRNTGIEKKARQKGQKAIMFALPDSKGNMVKLEELLEDGPVVINWYRGGWCPYCNLALDSYGKASKKIRDMGATVIAISPEPTNKATSTAKKMKLPYMVLSDKDNQVAKQYGIVFDLPDKIRPIYKKFGVDLPEWNKNDSWQLPLSATYVIGKDGMIRYSFIDADYSRRAEPTDVIDALKKLK